MCKERPLDEFAFSVIEQYLGRPISDEDKKSMCDEADRFEVYHEVSYDELLSNLLFRYAAKAKGVCIKEGRW